MYCLCWTTGRLKPGKEWNNLVISISSRFVKQWLTSVVWRWKFDALFMVHFRCSGQCWRLVRLVIDQALHRCWYLLLVLKGWNIWKSQQLQSSRLTYSIKLVRLFESELAFSLTTLQESAPLRHPHFAPGNSVFRTRDLSDLCSPMRLFKSSMAFSTVLAMRNSYRRRSEEE